MELLAQNILEFLESVKYDAEGVNLEEASSNASKKFGARMNANKRTGKRLTPSKYLKKYGSSWQNLKNETELEGDALQERDDSEWYKRGDSAPPKKMSRKESLQAKKDLVKGAWERGVVITTPVKEEVVSELKNETLGSYKEKAIGDIARVKEMRNSYLKTARKSSPAVAKDLTSMSKFLKARSEKRVAGIASATMKSTNEEVIPAKGNKKDKRANINPESGIGITPSGMNAGMRMMPEEILAEISSDKMVGAYRERLKLAAAHHTLGNKKEAKSSAIKALSHADAISNYDANRAKYAKHAVARSIVAKRAKPDATKPKED